MQETKFKTWQRYFKYKGIDPKDLPDVSKMPVEYQKPQIAQFILNVITDVENEGHIKDYTNYSQWKYELWLRVIADAKHPSGVGLSVYDYVFSSVHASTFSGVRLNFKDRATAIAVFTNFKKLYEDLYLPYYPSEAKGVKKVAPNKK